MSKRFKASPFFIEQDILKTLSAFEPLSHVEYAELSGINRVTAFDRLKKVKHRKLIYIKDWRRGESGPLRLFSQSAIFPTQNLPVHTRIVRNLAAGKKG